MAGNGADEVTVTSRSECDPYWTVALGGDRIVAVAGIISTFCHFCYVMSSSCKVENKNVTDHKSFIASPISIDISIGWVDPTQRVTDHVGSSGRAPP